MRISLLLLSSLIPALCSADNLRKLSSSSSSSSDEDEDITFLDQIQYPYDPWLPAEGDVAQRLTIPSLSQPFYDNVIDVRATVSAKDTKFILSTAGNWQFALTKYLNERFFVENPAGVSTSYLVSTSPPISVPQLLKGTLKVGNILYTDAQPHVAIGPIPLMDFGLDARGLRQTAFPFFSNYGNVILRLKSSNKVNCFADLMNLETGRFASAGPAEGAYNNYRNSVINIVKNNPEIIGSTSATAEADGVALANKLFGESGELVATIGPPMHQSVPHMLATGQADAGLMFLELAVGIMRNNPGLFEAIYIANDKVGMTDDPEILKLGQDPLAGNVVVTMFVTKTTVTVNADQELARTAFLEDLVNDPSGEFTSILAESGLRRHNDQVFGPREPTPAE